MEPYEVGSKVKLFGTVSYSSKSGRVSFIFKNVENIGEGALYSQFLQVKKRLMAEGLFDNKIKLGDFIKNIAIITSIAGAVIYDFMTAVYKYQKVGDIDIFPVSVQGTGSADEIVSAVKSANLQRYDVIVIARGGGSSSDLDAFNTEKVARVVAESKIPVISAVGHETDYTLCDFCASVRAGTPSIAGEIVSNINAKKIDSVYRQAENFASSFDKWLISKENRVKNAAKVVMQETELRYALTKKALQYNVKTLVCSVLQLTEAAHLRINNAAIELKNVSENFIKSKETYIAEAGKRLDKNSPLRILAKGYSKVLIEDKNLQSISEVNVGENLKILVKDGQIISKVTEKSKF